MHRKKRYLFWALGLGIAYLAANYALAVWFVNPPMTRINKPNSVISHQLPLGTIWTAGPPSNGETVFVFAHGYRGNIRHWLPAMEDLARRNLASVAFPMPGHPLSNNPTCSLGTNEADALLQTCRWVRRTYRPKRLIAVGVSMGGAACWLAADKDPGFADAIITESAFAHLDDAVSAWLGPGIRFALSPMLWMAQSRAWMRISNVNPIEGAKKWRSKPAVIFHITNDRTVPYAQGELLSQALGVPVIGLAGEHSAGYRKNQAKFFAKLIEIAGKEL